MNNQFAEGIFQIGDEADFNGKALEIFRYQAEKNRTYNLFLKELGPGYAMPKKPEDIPFLPVAFFRRHKIISGDRTAEVVFRSSGTTGSGTSRHYIADTALYERSFFSAFRYFYGDPVNYIIYALLPSYSESGNSSLIYMVRHLVKATGSDIGGFYKDDHKKLLGDIQRGRQQSRRLMIIGVSHALLDFAETCHPDLSGVIIMETGGMKGRRKEIIREDLHSRLKKYFNVDIIDSEYGMTELLSQAYSSGNEMYRCPPWMKILIRDPRDPLSVISEPGSNGGINIIDLANINSCSFIATDDIGRLHDDGSFEVLGRLDDSDIRGCNLLY